MNYDNIYKDALERIERDSKCNPFSCNLVGIPGPTGPQGIQGEIGPTGPAGSSVSVLGTYDTKEELEREHPIGRTDDSYLVDGNLYVWSDNDQKWEDIGNIKGPTGPRGEIGPTGPQGEAGPSKIQTAYLVTFNEGLPSDGVLYNSSDRLLVERSELDIDNLVTLNTDDKTLKFNLTGYYKITFIVSLKIIPEDKFDKKKDFATIGFRQINTDNVYIGASKWIYDDKYSDLTGQGIIAVDNPNNIYELVNLSPKTIYLNSPDITDIKSISYFNNSLVNIVVEYLGRK